MNTYKKLLASLLAVLQVATPMGAWAQSGPTTSIQYDAVGQVTQVTSPAGHTRQLQWDTLGRLQSESRGSTTVGYGYNGQDAVTSITDPRNLTTSYTRDGFGATKSQTSPDTNSSSYAYDLNGNLTSRINAAGQTESYTYDAADRVLTQTVSHPTQGSRTYTFTYGANGTSEAGALTQVSASGLTLTFAHNLFGQTTSATQTLAGSVAWTTGYSYAANGAPTGMTYPSGRVITYTLDAGSRITGIISGGTALLSNISYTAFGALSGWTFGSGQTVARTYDLNGRVTGVSMPAGTREYVYDADGRIVGINDPVLGSATYDYDDLDRLTSASTSLGSWTYQYDATGNRVTTSSATVSIDNYSNRVLSVNGIPSRLYAYTNDGQPRQVDGVTAAPGCGSSLALNYQADGQLASSNVLTAVHSPSGLRLQKTAVACAGSTTTNFVYDLAGHLLGEYDAAGNVIQETVWLGDLPVAVFKPSVAPTAFYVFADNLGSPRAITNASGQVVWQWDGEPFGAIAANSNPSGLGDFAYNLRFPGQYLDVETGFHHNGWREYDPALGRYLQSDPIGLAGGLNTYAYSLSNPLAIADPSGRCGVFTPACLMAGGFVVGTLGDAAYQYYSTGSVNWRAAAETGAELASLFAFPSAGAGRTASAEVGAATEAAALSQMRLATAAEKRAAVGGTGAYCSRVRPSTVDPAHHNANVTVKDASGAIVQQARVVSGNMTEAEKALGFPLNTLASHTEARAVRNMDIPEGGSMSITGQLPPCNSCKGAMNRKAEATGASITYKWRSNGKTNEWTTK